MIVVPTTCFKRSRKVGQVGRHISRPIMLRPPLLFCRFLKLGNEKGESSRLKAVNCEAEKNLKIEGCVLCDAVLVILLVRTEKE